MPNLILNINESNAIDNYINNTDNIIIVYHYSSKLEDKFNKLDKIKEIFPFDLPEDVYCTFIKCNLSKQLYTDKNKDQTFFLKIKNKKIIYTGPANKLCRIIKLGLHKKVIKTRFSKRTIC